MTNRMSFHNRVFLFVLITSIIILPLAKAQEKKTELPTQERCGKFTVVGTLVYEDKSPALGKEIGVAEVGEDGGVIVKGGKGGRLSWAGFGKTDDKGHFSIIVNRDYFKGKEIRFTLVPLIGPERTVFWPTPQLEDDKGGVIVLVMEEDAKEIDLNKIFGAIVFPSEL